MKKNKITSEKTVNEKRFSNRLKMFSLIVALITISYKLWALNAEQRASYAANQRSIEVQKNQSAFIEEQQKLIRDLSFRVDSLESWKSSFDIIMETGAGCMLTQGNTFTGCGQCISTVNSFNQK